MGIKDLTDADLKKINDKLKNAGSELYLTPKLAKDINEILPKGLKLELDPKLNAVSNEALQKAVEGKVMKVEITPLMTSLRKALRDATKDNPPEMEVGVQSAKLRKLIETVLNKQGFLINISTVNDNYTKVVQQKLNGTRYTVKIHADAKEITQSVQASLMQVQSRYFGLRVSRDILYRSIDEALGTHRFPINIVVQQDQARKAVQDALLRAQAMGKDQALAYQRMQTGELKAAQAELARLKAAQLGAASAAKAHATASIDLGGAMGSNIKIAGELGSAMASLYSIHAAKEFLSQVIEIGGELEHQKIAMDTIFGDKGKTNELFGQIKGLARQSPFGVMELTKSVKALSAYGVEYNEIYDTAKRLADISAATSVDINRLILAFGKTKSRGFLDGLEAKQFAYANIPIYEMVRKKLEELEGQAVTTADVMARMKKREIGFDIVKDVLWDITDPGGKFYDMQEALAGSVKTSWKLVRDNIELMFGEIAESSVGGALKSTAEILQTLTRNWRTLGAAIGAAALSFGVYRVAVAASNVLMGQANVVARQKAIASNKVAAANAMEAASYRALSQAEDYAILAKSGLAKLNRSLLLSHKALTEAEWDAVVASKAVSGDYILRRIALNRLTQAEIDYLISIEAVSAAEVEVAMRAQVLKISLASLYATVKTGVVSAWASALNSLTRFRTGIVGLGTSVKTLKFASLFTWIKTLPSRLVHAEVGVTRLKLAFSGLGRAISSIGTFLFSPVTIGMAAIGGLMYAWEKNNAQMEKAQEIGDNVFTKATEGASNLQQTLNGIKPSVGLSEHELSQGIEQMEQAIKDYSPRPLQDINDTLVAQDGHVLTLAERYDALKKKVEEVKAAYDLMGDSRVGDIGTMVSDAIQSTGGLLNDTVLVNAKDYTETLKKRSDAIRKATIEDSRYVKMAVDAAIEADGDFAKVAAGMKNTAAMFNELASNPEKYITAHNLPEVKAALVGVTDASRDLDSDKSKFESDVQKFIEDLTANIRITWDKEIKDLDDSQKDALAIALKNMLDQAEGVSEEVKMQWAKTLEKAFGIDLGFKVDATALIGDEFAANMEKLLGAELAAKVRKGLTLTPEEKSKVHNAIYKSYLAVFERADEDVRRALNDAMRGKKMQLQTVGIVALKANKNANASDWQQKILDELGGVDLADIDIKITGHSDLNSFIDEARKGYKAANEAIKELKPILIRAGIDFVDGQEITAVPLSLKGDDVALEAIDEYNKRVRATKAIKDTLKAQGIDLDVDPNKKTKGTQKDKFAESIKQRFKDIKDAWSEFQKWSKTEGRKAAATRIGESGLFSTLSADKIPQTVEQYRALVVELENELRKAGVKGTARESLLNDLLKQLLDIDKTVVDERLKLALDKVSKEAERQLADWNLFDKIHKATGNQDLAMSIAFGMDADAETDYPALVKKQFDDFAKAAKSTLTFDTATPELLAKAPDEVKKAWEDTTKKLQQYAREQKDAIADILNEYQSLQDKLTKIDADRDRKIKTVKESDMPEADKESYIRRINVEADYDIFTQSNEYLRFFNDIYGLTLDEANRIGDLIQLNLNQKLQAELITIYDYEKKMEKVRKQLESIRNVKPDAMTFLTGGLKGLNQKRLQKEEGSLANNKEYQKALEEQVEAQRKLNEAREQGNFAAILAAQKDLDLANAKVKTFTQVRDAIIKDMEMMENVLAIATFAGSVAQGLSDAFNTIRDIADALGVDTSSGAWDDIAAVMDTLTAVTGGIQKVVQSAMSGDVGGILSGVVSTIATPFTIWAQLHDKKLQKMIDRSKEAAQIMQNQYDILEKQMANFLGNAAAMNTGVEGGAYGKQRQLMQGQLAELQKQRQAEADKKKSDDSVLTDYDRQIQELQISIRDFALEAAKDLYGIDLNGWAEQLGDSLVDAFAAGEDAAKAFDSTVGDIMRDVTSKMISQDILAPMFGDLRRFLFGENGESGALGADLTLSPEDAAKMQEYIARIKNKGIPAAQELYDAIDSATGGLLSDSSASDSLREGIEGIKEDQADLLASYLNAVRADVSIQTTVHWPRLLDESLPQISVIAQSQLDCQRRIAEYARRNAEAAEAIQESTAKLVELNGQMGRSWRRIAERNWGYS